MLNKIIKEAQENALSQSKMVHCKKTESNEISILIKDISLIRPESVGDGACRFDSGATNLISF